MRVMSKDTSQFEVEVGKEYDVESTSQVTGLVREDGRLMLTIQHDKPNSYNRAVRVVALADQGKDSAWAIVWRGPVDASETLVVEQRERPRFDKYVSPIVLNHGDMRDLVQRRDPLQVSEAFNALRQTLARDLYDRYPHGLPEGAQLVLRATVLLKGETLS